MVLKGLVLVKLWSWFIVPVFGLPILSTPQAIGISLVIQYFVGVNNGTKDNTREEKVKGIINLFLMPIIALLLGFVVKLFL